MNRSYVVGFVDKIPQALVSRMWGWLARRKHPKVCVHLLKSVFVKATGINMQEAADPAIGAYPCLEDLFVRTLPIFSAELKIGVLTALIGTPFFIYLIFRSELGRGFSGEDM